MAGIDSILASLGGAPTRNLAKTIASERDYERRRKRIKDSQDYYNTVRSYMTPKQAFEATKQNFPDFPNVFANVPDYEGQERKLKHQKAEADIGLTKTRQKYYEAAAVGKLNPKEKTPTPMNEFQRERSRVGKQQVVSQINQGIKDGYTRTQIVEDILDNSSLAPYLDLEDQEITSALGKAPAEQEEKEKSGFLEQFDKFNLFKKEGKEKLGGTTESAKEDKSPYSDYPDAFLEDGKWKVVRNGKKYRIED